MYFFDKAGLRGLCRFLALKIILAFCCLRVLYGCYANGAILWVLKLPLESSKPWLEPFQGLVHGLFLLAGSHSCGMHVCFASEGFALLEFFVRCAKFENSRKDFYVQLLVERSWFGCYGLWFGPDR